MRSTGADRPVVAVNPGNAGGAKGPGYPGVDGGQPLRRDEPMVTARLKPFDIPKQAVWEAWLRVKANNPRPFIWTKSADQILASLGRLLQRTTGAGH